MTPDADARRLLQSLLGYSVRQGWFRKDLMATTDLFADWYHQVEYLTRRLAIAEARVADLAKENHWLRGHTDAQRGFWHYLKFLFGMTDIVPTR